ncbi:MAG: hypothetical protein OWT27_08620 [Firmicutes bacterium]|nr:hypothetical protein [Bacillota bacterium]
MSDLIPYDINYDGFEFIGYKKRQDLPYITVSAKGIANGLSDKVNDGADFGPDTPNTFSYGILEAWNYAVATGRLVPSNEIQGGKLFITPILLLEGIFDISSPITLTAPEPVVNPKIIGSGMLSTFVGTKNGITGDLITIDPSILNYTNVEIGYMQFYGSVTNYLTIDCSSVNYGANTFQSYDLNIAGNGPTNAPLNIQGMKEIYLYNYESYNGAGTYPGGFFTGSSGSTLLLFGGFFAGPIGLSNLGEAYISANIASGFMVNNVNELYISQHYWYGGIYLAGDTGDIYIAQMIAGQTAGPGSPFLQLASGTTSASVRSVIVGSFSGEYAQTYNLKTTTDITVANVKILGNANLVSGASLSGWVNSPTLPANPPASGTIYQNTNPYPIEIDLPVYASTSGTAGNVAYGISATDTVTEMTPEFVSGSTSSSAVDIIKLYVPAGWYYEFTYTDVTAGTATVIAR